MFRQFIGVRAWPFRLLPVLLVFALVVSWQAMPALSSETIVRVEEDWELVVGTPDPNTDAPQVTCVISPVANTDAYHGAFELNQQSMPVFESGGVQLQVWEGEVPISDRKYPILAILVQPDETVAWTQCMELDNGVLTFEIISGNSTTWGAFGGQGYLKAGVNSALADLHGYDPAVSVENSGMGYAANRVQSLVLKRVRRYTSNGAILEDDTVRVVHSQN